MGWTDRLSDFFFGAGRGAAGRALRNGEQYAYVGQDPHLQEQNALIQMLMQQANGTGPSLAESQYRGAMQDALAQQMAMSRGRGAGAARNAQNQMGAMGATLAGGGAEARLKERLGAMSQLQGSLTAANQADFQRAAANQAMYQQALSNMMQQGGIGQSLMGLAGQGLGAYAMLRQSKALEQMAKNGQGMPFVGGNPMAAAGTGITGFFAGLGNGIGNGIGRVMGAGQGGFSPFGGSPGPKDPWA